MSWESFALLEIILMGTLYVTGAIIYATRIPERYYPKTFDIFGSSHQARFSFNTRFGICLY